MMILGYLSASLAAALVLVMGLSGWNGLRGTAVDVFLAWPLILVYTFVPAFFAISYAAYRKIRSLWYYVLAGMGAGVFALLFTGMLLLPFLLTFPRGGGGRGWLHAVTVVVLGGIAAGLVFWALVGRKCGPGNVPEES